jgi:hypothetical protein
VYTLEKVLRLKKDGPATFLDEVMKVSSVTRLGIKLTSAQTLDDKPSFSFWTTLAKAFETQTKEAARCKHLAISHPGQH